MFPSFVRNKQYNEDNKKKLSEFWRNLVPDLYYKLCEIHRVPVDSVLNNFSHNK